MKIDPNRSKPLHLQAEEILRRLIEENDYKIRNHSTIKAPLSYIN